MGADELINGSLITVHEPDSIPLDISVVQALFVVRRLVACLFIMDRKAWRSVYYPEVFTSSTCLDSACGEKGGPSDIRHCKAAFYGKVLFMSILLILISRASAQMFSL